MLHRLAALALVAPLSLLAAAPAQAAPDEICLPEATPSPDWWSPGLTAARREARWSGADVRERTDGTRTARLRSVWSPQADKIFVEVRVDTDLSLDDEDAFVMAISDPTQAYPELLVEIHPLEDCPVWTDCSGAGIELDPASITFTEGTPTASSLTWSAPSSTNPSTDFGIYHPWIVVSRTGNKHTWTLSFAMTVPTDGAGDFAGRRIYGNAIAYHTGYTSGTYYELPVWCTSASMVSDTCTIYYGADPELPDDLPWLGLADMWSLVEAGSCS